MSRIKVKIKAQLPVINIKRYEKRIFDIMKEENINAIKKWLIAVLAKTPTYTGTARGTYAPIGRVVGRQVRRGVIAGSRAGARKKKNFRYKGTTLPLGFSQGANYQEHIIKTFKRGDKITSKFEFDQRLPYAVWNDIQVSPDWFLERRKTPWFSQQSGMTAYSNYVRRKWQKRLLAIPLIQKMELG